MTVANNAAKKYRNNEKIMGGIGVVVLMDGVQNPAVFTDPDPEGREMFWEGEFFKEALETSELGIYTLSKVHRIDVTKVPRLLEFCNALRREDHATIEKLLPEFEYEKVDDTFHDLVHDNFEIYLIADEKHGKRRGSQIHYARCLEGGPAGVPWDWNGRLQKLIREQSKLPLKHWFYAGQGLVYEPIGGAAARTIGRMGTPDNPKGWFLTKGEPLIVASDGTARLHEGLLKVKCPALKNAVAWIKEEKVVVKLGSTFGNVLLVGMPTRYDDISTVYSDQVC